MLEHLENERRASRRELLDRFRHDDPEAIAAVLNDLVQTGLASRSGSGAATLFTTTGEEERRVIAREGKAETAAALVWLDLCRHPNATSTELAARLGVDEEILAAAVDSLRDQGRITTRADRRAVATSMSIPIGATAGGSEPTLPAPRGPRTRPRGRRRPHETPPSKSRG